MSLVLAVVFAAGIRASTDLDIDKHLSNQNAINLATSAVVGTMVVADMRCNLLQL